MDPAWDDLGKWGEHESAQVGARVGEDRIWRVPDQTLDINQVEIKAASGIDPQAAAAEARLDCLEGSQQRGGIGMAGEQGNSVHIIRLI